MLRSMFSGVSGLRSHQTMMDVVGNNISNVNTTGYKSSNVVFADTMSQLTKAAGAPQNGQGGTNPAQVGLGVRVNSISQNFTQGSSQSTGRATDLMLNGDGMFVVKQGEQTLYTRSGAFTLDQTGAVTTADGAYVQGWRADAMGEINVNGPTTPLIVPSDTVMPAAQTTLGTFKGNLDKTGKPVLNADGTTYSGPVVTTSFDLFNAQGARTKVTATFKNDPAAGGSATATPASAYQPGDSWQVTFSWPDPLDPSATITSTTPAATMAFDANGAPTGTLPTAFDFNGREVGIDLSKMTGSVSSNGASTISSTADGAPIGTLTSFAFGTDGVLTGSYSNGLKRALGQVAVATFNNYAGLERSGGSMFTVTTNSGVPNVGAPGAAGRATLGAGQLEMSNVDLSAEFTNLILAQRGFQANSRIISASDEILQDLVNLKR
ncbi:flagellar hook protein FlgE [Kineococcus xinjiangensis]|uniref:Flagellar hook protein FlgE n=1 Tax=Kineococcus xinjiangensis TaxID=512762 RepID=A0A2S6IJY3_9ACTN|nr:flagellar hook protein FlgE [Kineococcus xinjiangensis]PPK94519.1 flagellar hook protein FlgE [Kineococcus xinjiangensis]